MQQPAHVKSLAATFRGAGYQVTVARNPTGWSLMPAVSGHLNNLVGLVVDDLGSVTFYSWRLQDERGTPEQACIGKVNEVTDRDIVTQYLECDKEGLESLIA